MRKIEIIISKISNDRIDSSTTIRDTAFYVSEEMALERASKWMDIGHSVVVRPTYNDGRDDDGVNHYHEFRSWNGGAFDRIDF